MLGDLPKSYYFPMAKGISILEEYAGESKDFDLLAAEVKRLLTTLLADRPVQIHSTETRVKSKESLERKLAREPRKYQQLRDVTDVCEARYLFIHR